MSALKLTNSGMMDTNDVLFKCDKNIIGASLIDDTTILITDEVKVIKYEVDSRRVLQEWRSESGCKFLSSATICKDGRYYATTDSHTIAIWKNSSTHISERCKKIKVAKSCFGLAEHMGHIFAIHHDGSLSLFGDTKKWCHSFSKDLNILCFNKVPKGHRNCDIIIVMSDGLDTKVAKYDVQVQDQEVNVNVDAMTDCNTLLNKFSVDKSTKVLFLDELQSVVYGILKETKAEGVYLLNERNGSVKMLMQFESHSCGEMIQMLRRQDSILLVTSMQILEMNLKYKSPFLCNIIGESQVEDYSEESRMECESALNDNSFDELCQHAKAWLQSKGRSLGSLDQSQDIQRDLQEYFSTKPSLTPAKSVTINEKIALVPLFCAYPFDLNAKIFVEMTSFILSMSDDTEHKENVPFLLNQIIESILPDDMLKSLASVEFRHVKILLEHLYNKLLTEELHTEKVVDWISMLLDSHHTHIMVSKDWELVTSLKQLVDALCEEAKEDPAKRFAEKLKFSRLQKRSKSRRGCYVEMFEL